MNEIGDIPVYRDKAPSSPEVIKLRENAPTYFVSLIENGVLENVTSIRDIPSESVVPLGGRNSACYIYENNGRPEVAKFGNVSILAEAQTLKAFTEHGVTAPEVKGSGTVPGTETDDPPVKYVVLEGITTKEGNPAPTGDKYLAEHPEQSAVLAKTMAEQLARIHRIPSDRPFGGFEDAPGSNADTVAEYFAGKIDDSVDILGSIGITTDGIDALKEKLKTIKFPTSGVVVHGDFLPNNVLVGSQEPLTVKVIDPMPSINDPYWDIARYLNEYEANEGPKPDEQVSSNPNPERDFRNAFIEKYEIEQGPLDPTRLLANQIIYAFGHIRRREERQAQTGAAGADGVPAVDRRMQVIKDQLKERILRFMNPAAMRSEKIPAHEVDLKIPEPTRSLRLKVGDYFADLVTKNSIPGASTIDDIDRMTAIGGLDSAGYLFDSGGVPSMIKFGYFPAETDAKILTMFGQNGVAAPRVIGYGTVPETAKADEPVQYIILEGIELDGKPAPTSSDYIKLHPDRARELGLKMAKQLLAIHHIPSDQLPADATDVLGEGKPATIAEYFASQIDKGSNVLHGIGMTGDDIAALKATFERINFPTELAIIHGGFHLYNILVESEDPLAIRVIDPTPFLNDPYADIARYLNTYDITKAFTRERYSDDEEFLAAISHEKALRDGLVEGYEEGIGQKLDPRRLLANQIIFALGHIERNEKREVPTGVAGVSGIPFQQEHRVVVMKEKLKDYIKSLQEAE
jgi:aminoglycoside phosphotransferase (APT) family kinase protein